MGRFVKVTRRGLFVLSLLCVSGGLFLTQATAQGSGNVGEGEDLFTGAQPLENGGPPCMACHSAGDMAALGGGQLGPDLTPAFDKYGGAQGFAATLGSLPFPTMQPVFGPRPLTPAEQDDLLAFFEQASVEKRSGNATLTLFLWGVGGAVVLLVLAGLVWMRHLNGVRKPMVARSKRTS
ncbi:MAG: hypothetical protein JJLCMIEE_03245 [Acidimicrobiales bacterium]|nr:MAG: cytochrome c [Actinomycetota bacterium]MBV6510125.1 hypothetical protein [Acidimicrobiales bacterium]RIK05763.1 MAG: hypothetical protein DCC48_08830 [Acidobacteriota bacterium]